LLEKNRIVTKKRIFQVQKGGLKRVKKRMIEGKRKINK
jgi:hypothetical protein